jgi:hypothetical protein
MRPVRSTGRRAGRGSRKPQTLRRCGRRRSADTGNGFHGSEAKRAAPWAQAGGARGEGQGAAMPRKEHRHWSQEVTAHSDALDLEPDVFAKPSAEEIAESLKNSAESSSRRKGSAFQSAMSMLTFYINREGRIYPSRGSARSNPRKALCGDCSVERASGWLTWAWPARSPVCGISERPWRKEQNVAGGIAFSEKAESPCPIRPLTRRQALGRPPRRHRTPAPR